MYDVGSGRYSVGAHDAVGAEWEAGLARVHEESAAAHKARLAANANDRTHTEVQGWLRDLGLALGYRVWVASNDKGRPYGTGRLGDGCLAELPATIRSSGAGDTVALIDVLWLDETQRIRLAFEVEHSTSIYSGIVRMLDLALGVPQHDDATFFLVAPDAKSTMSGHSSSVRRFRGCVNSTCATSATVNLNGTGTPLPVLAPARREC